MSKDVVEPDKSQMTLWRTRIACWIAKAARTHTVTLTHTHTHTQYVILIVFPQQRRLHKSASILLYT
jgi:hypothetical protein